MRYFVPLLFSGILLSCSSAPPAPTGPDWIRQPTRIVDGGYIVYIGTATASRPERAQFEAEGLALEDLANECSMIPKGARIEDRYSEKDKKDSKAWVKLALEFQECEEAKKALDPEAIKKIANVGFTQQLKKYQDLMETGEMPQEVAEVEPPAEMTPPPARGGWNDNTHFFVMRQYVAYQKEVVVLAPPTAYAVNSPASQSFTRGIAPTVEQIHGVEQASPALRGQAWSQVPARPVIARPASLAARPMFRGQVRPPGQHGQRGGLRKPMPAPAKKRRGRQRRRD
jgi:hypothetical protein